jgi:DNA-binding CsgD family transcriptional regulator
MYSIVKQAAPGHVCEIVEPEHRTSDGEGRAPSRSGDLRARGSTAKRKFASWVNWQSALYLIASGWVCVVLAPLTSFWWLALVFASVVPIALSVLDKPGLESSDERKVKEGELLHTLAERREITAATAAMWTSLTVDEAAKMLDELARKGHLRPRAEGGVIAYALREWDQVQGKVSAPAEQGHRVPRRLGAQRDDPLSEREHEVLNLLASGRTNSEIARDLFISVGTVKSHTGNIYRKLEAKNRAEALARARELELLR